MKKLLRVIILLLLILAVIAASLIIYVKTAMPNVGEATDLKIEYTPERIERGRYLANSVTVCMDCHSTRDWSIYAGPAKAETFGAGGERFGHDMGFPGELYSKNITPAGIGNWTDGEIFRAITSGVNKEGKALFPLMAYPNFGRMDPEDIYSIISYIRTLQPVKSEIPARELDFPVSIIVNTMPHPPTPGKRPDPANKIEYGKYLVNAAGCVECHSKTDKGAVIAGTEFGGGFLFKQPNGVVTSMNISPDKQTGIGNWNEQAFISRFKIYADSSYQLQHLNQKDLNTPMPWLMYSNMTEQDLSAIYAFLQTVKPIKNKIVKFESNNQQNMYN